MLLSEQSILNYYSCLCFQTTNNNLLCAILISEWLMWLMK